MKGKGKGDQYDISFLVSGRYIYPTKLVIPIENREKKFGESKVV
jgi:hypothetical protein